MKIHVDTMPKSM
jgi:hypothetical protein